MPTYDYQCRTCGAVTEVIHSMLEDGPTVCEQCGGELRRVLYPAGIIFKGPGFYSTDSRSSGGSTSATKPSGSKAATDAASSSPGSSGPSGSKGSGTGDGVGGTTTASDATG